MSIYHSGFSDSVEAFVNSRKISGAWNETVFGLNIRIFDHYRRMPTKDARRFRWIPTPTSSAMPKLPTGWKMA